MGIATKPQRRSSVHDFDVDNYLNQLVPRPRFHYLPKAVSRFFGYRPPIEEGTHLAVSPKQPSSLVVWLFSFLGAFVGITIIENVYLVLPRLDGKQVPVVIGSFGAAAVLEYNTIESPLAQPRNLLFGHLLSAVIGIGTTKLFQLLPPERFEELRWLAGTLAVGISSSMMGVTKTIHPPAGATALLAATSPEITDLGWWLLAVILLGCLLMLTSAMLINNLYRRFPLYWWTPADLQKWHQKDDILTASEAEQGEASGTKTGTGAELTAHTVDQDVRSESDTTFVASRTGSHRDLTRKESRLGERGMEQTITISPDRIVVPDWMELTEWEKNVLEIFRDQLRHGVTGEET